MLCSDVKNNLNYLDNFFEKEFLDMEQEEAEKLAGLYNSSDEVNTLFRSKKLYFDRDIPVEPELPDGCPEFDPQREKEK